MVWWLRLATGARDAEPAFGDVADVRAERGGADARALTSFTNAGVVRLANAGVARLVTAPGTGTAAPWSAWPRPAWFGEGALHEIRAPAGRRVRPSRPPGLAAALGALDVVGAQTESAYAPGERTPVLFPG